MSGILSTDTAIWSNVLACYLIYNLFKKPKLNGNYLEKNKQGYNKENTVQNKSLGPDSELANILII